MVRHSVIAPHHPILALGTLLGVVALSVLSWGGLQAAQPGDLHPLEAADLESLEHAFGARGYAWPPEAGVPPLALRRLPDGLDDAGVARRKAAFLRSLLPLVLAENDRIRRERSLIERHFADPSASSAADRQRVTALAARYGVDGDLGAAEVQGRLLRRVDTIPPALALAQAAIESGWGTSRFAREGNSLFGQWTWDPDAGIAPERRAPGESHAVRRFPDLRASVRAYLHNLNRGHAYAELRRLRARQRAAGESPDPVRLAAGLRYYSERREAYVEELIGLMRANALVAGLEGVSLAGR